MEKEFVICPFCDGSGNVFDYEDEDTGEIETKPCPICDASGNVTPAEQRDFIEEQRADDYRES